MQGSSCWACAQAIEVGSQIRISGSDSVTESAVCAQRKCAIKTGLKGFLQAMTRFEKRLFSEMGGEHLDPHGKTVVRFAAGHGKTGDPGEIGGDGVDVREVHGDRIVRFFPRA